MRPISRHGSEREIDSARGVGGPTRFPGAITTMNVARLRNPARVERERRLIRRGDEQCHAGTRSIRRRPFNRRTVNRHRRSNDMCRHVQA